ncbi:uncharacterized protein LOC135483953 [Lineus longissimus]|uniref:uncharacterized protein LOC135483953 n=1 Tax=Lineus longissimus TaxID=88925 RepID=UPI00315D9B78
MSGPQNNLQEQLARLRQSSSSGASGQAQRGFKFKKVIGSSLSIKKPTTTNPVRPPPHNDKPNSFNKNLSNSSNLPSGRSSSPVFPSSTAIKNKAAEVNQTSISTFFGSKPPGTGSNGQRGSSSFNPPQAKVKPMAAVAPHRYEYSS